MSWKKTIIKQPNIQWQPIKIEVIEDGKIDLDLHIPLTQIVELQACQSYSQGILDALEFVLKMNGNDVTKGILSEQFRKWDMPNELIEFIEKGGK